MGGYIVFLIPLFLATLVHADDFINITFLDSAVAKGAVCLDGSPPAYSYLEGSGDGTANWIVYLQGGGWCESKEECRKRSLGSYGSSNSYHNRPIFFSGLLDTNQTFNPYFNNWHKVYVIYCDGSSFMSDVEQVDPETNVTYRGARIFNAVMEEMLLKGMGSAQNAILTGGSAGGLATILHCDIFRALFPDTTRLKCISDSGFFIHAPDQPGVYIREQRFAGVVATHELADSLPRTCTSQRDPSLCLFPEYLVEDIQTPLFFIESAFDKYQIENNLIPSLNQSGEWGHCPQNLTSCDPTELGILKDFGNAFIETLDKLKAPSSTGMFVHSCYLHQHILERDEWFCSSVGGNTLANKTIGETVSDWYYDQSPFQEIDTQSNGPRNCKSTVSGPIFDQTCLASLPNGSKPFV